MKKVLGHKRLKTDMISSYVGYIDGGEYWVAVAKPASTCAEVFRLDEDDYTRFIQMAKKDIVSSRLANEVLVGYGDKAMDMSFKDYRELLNQSIQQGSNKSKNVNPRGLKNPTASFLPVSFSSVEVWL